MAAVTLILLLLGAAAASWRSSPGCRARGSTVGLVLVEIFAVAFVADEVLRVVQRDLDLEQMLAEEGGEKLE